VYFVITAGKKRMVLSRRQSIVFVLLMMASTFTGVFALRAPTAKPKSSLLQEFSAERAIEKLKPLADEPRPIGSEGHAKAREYLLLELKQLGLTPTVQEAVIANSFVGWVKAARVKNIVARLKGSESSGAILVAAHYDSVPNSLGASDDGAGVVAILEAVRAVLATGPLRNDLIVLFTDAEENGSLGASAFAFEHPWAKDIRIAFNFEARGSRGPSAMFETSLDNGRLIQEFADAKTRPIGNSFIAAMAKILPNDTDFTVFKRAGFSGLNFAYADGLNHYHSFADNVENLDPNSLQHHGEYALSLLTRLGNSDLKVSPQPSRVYFDLLGLMLVHYLPVWNFVLVAVIFILFLCLGYSNRHALKGAHVAAGAGWFLLMVAASAVLTSALMYLLLQFEPVSLTTAYAKFYFAAFALVTGGFFLWFLNRRERVGRAQAFALGACFVWQILSLITTFTAPGMAYLFQWPLLFALLSFGLIHQRMDRVFAWARFLGIGCLASALTLFAANTTYMMHILDGGMTPAIPSVFFALFIGLLSPILFLLPFVWRRKAAVVSVVAGVVMIFVMSAVSTYSPQIPQRNSINYVLDATEDRAHWFSYNQKNDEFVDQFIKDFDNKAMLPNILQRNLSVALEEAPIAAWAPPEVKIISEELKEESKVVQLLIRSRRNAPCITLWQESGAKISQTRIDKKAPHALVRFSPKLDKKLWGYMTGDTSTVEWKMNYCGLDETGFKISLVMAQEGKVKLRLVDVSYGLPLELIPSYKGRTASMIPSQWSEASMSGTMFEF
jgi:hypothetical protein